MTFAAYDPNLATDLSYVRFKIGDTQENTGPEQGGPRPDKRNFSDEEITAIITDEGHKVAAIAGLFEVLANEWSAWALSEKEGEVSIDAKAIADMYAKRAAFWRKKPNGSQADDPDTIIPGVVGLDLQQTDTVND